MTEDEDPAKVREVMHTFRTTGTYVFDRFDSQGMLSSRTDDAGISQLISDVHQKYGYVVDPHTACGFDGGFSGPQIILATAHPAKFPKVIIEALGHEATHPSLETLKAQ